MEGLTLNPKPFTVSGLFMGFLGKSVYFVVVWSFLLFGPFGCFFLLFGWGRVIFFAVWAGPGSKKRTRPPAQTAKKKNTPPAQTAKKKHNPRPNSKKRTRPPPKQQKKNTLPGPNSKKKQTHPPAQTAKKKHARKGRGRVFFLLFGPGACFFFAVWAGDGSSLTYRSAWLVFKRPNNKNDQTAKKKTRVPGFLRAPQYKRPVPIQGFGHSGGFFKGGARKSRL